MSSSPPLSTDDLLTIIGETQPIPCSAHCEAVAAPLNAIHNARYAATKKSVLVASLRLRFNSPKHKTIGAAEGSIMAAIMTAHMMNTASQFASVQSDMGIVSCAAGLSILVAPQNKRSQHPSVAAKIPAAVHGRAKIKLRDDAVK